MSVFQDILKVLRSGTTITAPSTVVYAEKALAAAANYAAEDVLNDIATAGQGAQPWRFDGMARRKGGKGTITKIFALCSTTALTPGITLYFYRSIPTCELVDNEAHDGIVTNDRYKYVGQIALPAMSDLGGNSESIAVPSTEGNLPFRFDCDPGDDGLYFVPVLRDAVTGEAAGMGLMFCAFVEQD